jgi:hypothetical protein
MTQADDPMPGVLDMLAAHAERIDRLAAAQAAAETFLTEVAALARDLDGRIAVLGRPGPDASEALGGEPAGPGSAREPQAPAGEGRGLAVARLRTWTDEVYRPGYGQLAATLGPCWDQHPLCLHALDILAGLHGVLYVPGERSPAVLSMRAEYQARILPALAEQMAVETARCRHLRDHAASHARTGR